MGFEKKVPTVMRCLVGALSRLLNGYYRLQLKKTPRRNLVLFLSRQSNSLSADFSLVAKEFGERSGWEIAACVKMLDGGLGDKIKYALHMFEEVKLLAQCRICFVEGYNPALSLLDLENEHVSDWTINKDCPTRPLVFQLWHASGMYKRFGFLAAGTAEGRSAAQARLFKMHRNYSWIVTSGSAACAPYAAALGYPAERAVALGRPSCDLLYQDPRPFIERARKRYPQLRENGNPVVLFAPTLRRTQDVTEFDKLRSAIEKSSWASDYELVWSYHPVLTPNDVGRIPTGVLLRCADMLVTDYSSIVYDAALLKCPVAFYIPDIDDYRESPGLITDPVATSPGICFREPEALMNFISKTLPVDGGCAYDDAPLAAFVGESLNACEPGNTKRIVDFALCEAAKQEEGAW